jgi:heme-degrading monooxygenase HmoA
MATVASARKRRHSMFIAMNRFSVRPDRSEDFERAWRERETFLQAVPGFVRFALLRGDLPGEYISHSTWVNREAFKAWTQSQEFSKAHGQGLDEGILADHPRVAFYEAVLEQEGSAATVPA